MTFLVIFIRDPLYRLYRLRRTIHQSTTRVTACSHPPPYPSSRRKARVGGEVSGGKGARQTHRGPSSNVRRRRQECVRRRHRENLAKTPTQFLSTPKSTPHRLTPSQTTSYTDQLEVFLCFDSIFFFFLLCQFFANFFVANKHRAIALPTQSPVSLQHNLVGSGGDMSDLSDLAILRRVIDHVFLPRHTPDARDDVDAMADSHFAFLLVAFFEAGVVRVGVGGDVAKKGGGCCCGWMFRLAIGIVVGSATGSRRSLFPPPFCSEPESAGT